MDLNRLLNGRETGTTSHSKIGGWMAALAAVLAVWVSPQTVEAVIEPAPESTMAKIIATLGVLGLGTAWAGFRDVLGGRK